MALVDTQYVPAVTDARRLALARVELIGNRLRTPAAASRFLLWLFALRVGPLRSIPEWLEASARGCMSDHPGVALDLLETAELEREHQRVLFEDLEVVRQRAPELDFEALIRAPFDRCVEQHLCVRKLVPIGLVPTIVLAIDLELALLDRDGGRLLLRACDRMLRGAGCGFLHLRQQDAERRIEARMRQLRTILDEPRAATSWAKISSKVLLSYVDVLERSRSHVEVAGVERVLGDELAARADFVAHQNREHVVR